MKKVYFASCILALLLYSCSKDGIPEIGQNPDLLVKNVTANPAVAVIEVHPGEDLATAIEQAKAAGKGSVVKLMEGTHQIGVTEVREFFGTITGEGKGITLLTNLPGITPGEIILPGKLPSLITFIGGDITIHDLSVQLSMTEWLGNFEFNLMLFSDYSSDYMPSEQQIKIQLKNVEIKGLRRMVPPLSFPFPGTTGVKCSPDILRDSPQIFPRSNIDLTVSNSTLSDLWNGLYVWGCKKGNLDIGTNGGNLFDGNGKGLLVNENLGVNVKIYNNEFNTPARHGNGIDLNTGEEALNQRVPLEVSEADAGTYKICNNTFNVTGPANAIGLMDAWRLAHPEYPTWMKMIWQDNRFVLNNQGAFLGWTYCVKNILFEKNTIAGNDIPYSRLINTNFYWTTLLPNNTSEGCRFINNHFLRKNFVFYLDLNVNDYLLNGDLTNVTIQDFGENNIIIGKTNPNHANGTSDDEINPLKEREGNIF